MNPRMHTTLQGLMLLMSYVRVCTRMYICIHSHTHTNINQHVSTPLQGLVLLMAWATRRQTDTQTDKYTDTQTHRHTDYRRTDS